MTTLAAPTALNCPRKPRCFPAKTSLPVNAPEAVVFNAKKPELSGRTPFVSVSKPLKRALRKEIATTGFVAGPGSTPGGGGGKGAAPGNVRARFTALAALTRPKPNHESQPV